MEHAISSGQVRAARALIGWSRDQLAKESGATTRTVARFELGEGTTRPATVQAIRSALESAGVEFIPENGGGPGVRLRKADPAEKHSLPTRSLPTRPE